MTGTSRRELVSSVLPNARPGVGGFPARRRKRRPPTSPCGPASFRRTLCRAGSCSGRAYRADAAASLLGVTVFARQGVGSGIVILRGRLRKANVKSFRCNSPVNRVQSARMGSMTAGSIEEIVIERSSTPVEAAYFAFVSGAPSDLVDDTRQRVEYQRPGGVIESTSYTRRRRPASRRRGPQQSGLH